MGMVQLDSVTLFYEEAGHGQPLLLIHGTQPDAEVWGAAFSELAKDFRTISYDRRGFSRSKHTPIKDYVQHAKDAAALLQKLNAAPAIVLGWSWGGIVALELAAAHPELVDSLVLIEPAVHVKKHIRLGVFKAIFGVQLRRIRNPNAAVDGFFRWAHSYRTGGTAYDNFTPQQRATVHQNAAAILAEIDAGTGEKLSTQRIASIKCPVLLIHGDVSQPEFIAATHRIQKLLPQAQVEVIQGGSHALHIDKTAEFAKVMRKRVLKSQPITA